MLASMASHVSGWHARVSEQHGRATGLTGTERGKLGLDRIGGDMLASMASHVRGWHAQASEQQRDAVCIVVAAYVACGITSHVGEV